MRLRAGIARKRDPLRDGKKSATLRATIWRIFAFWDYEISCSLAIVLYEMCAACRVFSLL